MNVTKQNATLGRDWLIQMGEGAAKSSVSIQYCMACVLVLRSCVPKRTCRTRKTALKCIVSMESCRYPRMVMQTLEIPAVTQVRASCDYHPGNTDGCKAPYCQYNVGTSSLLAYATGLAPSKDNWWTSEHQPGGAFIFKMGRRFSQDARGKAHWFRAVLSS